eukprot:TRINITY_DN272_c0_g2_i1.p1 TRINITY_DN272_c0_g2~~TRINITY_DN272_c0_g2_i1.p1  ORF type:complete len:163 (+),score=8.44 TRINITY_DN272_c0_g2_i1:438-926(+)
MPTLACRLRLIVLHCSGRLFIPALDFELLDTLDHQSVFKSYTIQPSAFRSYIRFSTPLPPFARKLGSKKEKARRLAAGNPSTLPCLTTSCSTLHTICSTSHSNIDYSCATTSTPVHNLQKTFVACHGSLTAQPLFVSYQKFAGQLHVTNTNNLFIVLLKMLF